MGRTQIFDVLLIANECVGSRFRIKCPRVASLTLKKPMIMSFGTFSDTYLKGWVLWRSGALGLGFASRCPVFSVYEQVVLRISSQALEISDNGILMGWSW